MGALSLIPAKGDSKPVYFQAFLGALEYPNGKGLHSLMHLLLHSSTIVQVSAVFQKLFGVQVKRSVWHDSQ